MSFFKNILSRLTGAPAEAGNGTADAADDAAKPSVHLAVFGKHPAWDDHIDDIGLDTQRLIDVKRTFYLHGVGKNLDAGTWGKLEPKQRLKGFNHFFLWRAEGSEVIGRVLASTDGKGRGRFPLVVCMECVGLPPERVAGEVAPLLDDAMIRCSRAASRDEVLAVLAETRRQLKQLGSPAAPGAMAARTAAPAEALSPAAQRSSSESFSPHPAPTLADLVQCPDLHDDPSKLHSVLFQIEREMQAFVPGLPDRTFSTLSSAAHLRVPACEASPAQSARLWIDLLFTRLDESAPVLAVVAVDQGWVDLLVGAPRSQDFFCLLASRTMLPFTTDIPFNMDAPFHAKATRWVAGMAPAGAASAR